jgi:hypothetical protein
MDSSCLGNHVGIGQDIEHHSPPKNHTKIRLETTHQRGTT